MAFLLCLESTANTHQQVWLCIATYSLIQDTVLQGLNDSRTELLSRVQNLKQVKFVTYIRDYTSRNWSTDVLYESLRTLIAISKWF